MVQKATLAIGLTLLILSISIISAEVSYTGMRQSELEKKNSWFND